MFTKSLHELVGFLTYRVVGIERIHRLAISPRFFQAVQLEVGPGSITVGWSKTGIERQGNIEMFNTGSVFTTFSQTAATIVVDSFVNVGSIFRIGRTGTNAILFQNLYYVS